MPNQTEFSPTQTIPYGRQTIGDEEIQAVIDVLKSPYITQGPAIEKFEQAVAAYCDVPYAVGFCNGTAALHGAYYAAGIGPGDEVITSSITFVATSNAVLYQGGKPVFADISPNSWNINPQEIACRITPKTKAIAPVHFAGSPVALDSIYQLADEHHLVVIEDACHALGARYKNTPIGHCRDMAVFSFHPVKSITTGEGGMVVTPHRHFYEKLLKFRTHGITKDSQQFKVFEDQPWQYEMQDLGYNYRMTDIQAAIGTVQMQKLDGFMERRSQIAQRYREAFRDIPAIQTQEETTGDASANHLFPIWIDVTKTPINRTQLFKALQNARIAPQVHYIPVHLQPYYQEHLRTKQGDFPEAERYHESCLSLPIYPTLSHEEQDYVIKTIKACLS